MLRAFLSFLALAAAVHAQPTGAAPWPLDELKPGQKGEVWTVFHGSQPEPFSVQVTGVVRNALGPGKSLILCELTDPRVQNMGAVAGMSGSPLYIEGRLAGALAYQIQRFETVRYAGFTPAADLAEVQARTSPTLRAEPVAAIPPTDSSAYRALQPVFTLSGLSPVVAALFEPRFSALGLNAMALGGATTAGADAKAAADSPVALRPGSAIAVALATGDITLAGTGTVSSVNGDRVTAFGHPMLSLGEVELPMCAADIVTILPSSERSIKVANTGRIIGTISQDRLSAVSGSLGPGPAMIEVEVQVAAPRSATRTMRFSVARQPQLTPLLVAAGVTQAIMGANDAGLANGFRLSSDVQFPAAEVLAMHSLYAGPQGFQQGLNEFIQRLAANLQNPYAKTFPDRVSFSIEPLETNPAVTLDQFQVSRATARPGDVVQLTLAWRDFQGAAHREVIDVAIDPAWSGKKLEVILAPGRLLDELTGRPRAIAASELRSFDAYLAALRDDRPNDGLCLAVVESTEMFTDQTVATPEAPGSIERIARAADEARFHKREAVLPLWERHLLKGKLATAVVRRPLRVLD